MVVTCVECGHLCTSPLVETELIVAVCETYGDCIKQADVEEYTYADG
jgi:hypothetical protein